MSAEAPWTPFERMLSLRLPGGEWGPVPEGMAIYANNRYQVIARAMPSIFGEMLWLSIKRRDKESIHDWRDLQRIKNELAGPEDEAVELYPAESRLVDTSNQYHLWVLPKGMRMPFGFDERLVGGPAVRSEAGPKQRSWGDDAKPSDAQDLDVPAQRAPEKEGT
jgi:hypothetical protein